MKQVSLTLLFLLFMGHVSAAGASTVTVVSLGDHNEKEVKLFTLTNKQGNEVKLTNYGARLVFLSVPDKNGVKENITSGGTDLQSIVRGDMYGGATIGRFANRIANGTFKLDNQEYKLDINNRPNSLHGGRTGWHAKVWDAEIASKKRASVRFSLVSPHMDEGFPGEVQVAVIYTWTDKNELVIEYQAKSSQKTIINLTNHAYFNLFGMGKGSFFEHMLTIHASHYTPLNQQQIPTGEILPVRGTPFDFTTPKTMGEDLGKSFNEIAFSGYDHNLVLDKKQAATVYEPKNGRCMEVYTTEPGLQFYTGNGMMWKNSLAENQQVRIPRGGFALETQHFPDSPNHASFPSTVLEKGKKFKSKTVYTFSVR